MTISKKDEMNDNYVTYYITVFSKLKIHKRVFRIYTG